MARGVREEACCRARSKRNRTLIVLFGDRFQVELQRSKEYFRGREYYDKVISKECRIQYTAHLYSAIGTGIQLAGS